MLIKWIIISILVCSVFSLTATAQTAMGCFPRADFIKYVYDTFGGRVIWLGAHESGGHFFELLSSEHSNKPWFIVRSTPSNDTSCLMSFGINSHVLETSPISGTRRAD